MSFLFDLSMSLNCSIFKPICGEKGGDSNGSLRVTVPETVNLKLNMEVVTVDATFITAILVISFMYQWFKEKITNNSRKGDFYYDEQQF